MKMGYSAKERCFSVFLGIFFIICAAITVFPVLSVVAQSLSSSRALSTGEVGLLPVETTLDAYKNLVRDGQIFRSIYNTVIITVVGVVLNMLFTICAAYPLSKKNLDGSKVILMLITFTMMFNGGMIPTFILVKKLHLINTYSSLWCLGLISTYNMFVMRTFFEGIPASLEESAAIDGANDIVILIKIVLPISMPVIATLTLFYAVSWWNIYFNAVIYISSSAKAPLMVKLKQMIDNVSQELLTTTSGSEGVRSDQITPQGMPAAAIITSTIPILCVYPFLQKYFVKGVMIGSIKG